MARQGLERAHDSNVQEGRSYSVDNRPESFWRASAPAARNPRDFVLVCCVNEHHPSNVRWKQAGINPDVCATERMSDEHIWRRYARSARQSMQILSDCFACSWERTGIAPAISSAVVPTNIGKLSDPRLNQEPRIARGIGACIQDDRRSPGTCAIDVQSSTTDVYRSPHLWKPLSIVQSADSLIRRPGDYNSEYSKKKKSSKRGQVRSEGLVQFTPASTRAKDRKTPGRNRWLRLAPGPRCCPLPGL
jgi:hypothetical protein